MTGKTDYEYIQERHKHGSHRGMLWTLVYAGSNRVSIAFHTGTVCRSGYKGFVLGYNSDHEAAKRAQAELAEEFGVRSVCVQVGF